MDGSNTTAMITVAGEVIAFMIVKDAVEIGVIATMILSFLG